MQAKLTKKFKKIDKLKDIPPHYHLSTGAKTPSTRVCRALLHLQLSSKKTPLFTNMHRDIIYANTHCLCGYMELWINSYMFEYMHICVYLLWWCGYICAVLAVNIVPWLWWANTQSSQLWSCATKRSATLILADHLIMIVHVSTPGETVPYAHLIRYMMFSAHVIIKRSCSICSSVRVWSIGYICSAHR